MNLSKENITLTIWKYLVFIIIIAYNPFVLRDDYIGVPISTAIYALVFAVAILLNIKTIKPSEQYLYFALLIILTYLTFNFGLNYKYFFSTLNDLMIVSISFVVSSQFQNFNVFTSFYKFWIGFLWVVASMTIFSYAMFFFQLIPFYNIELGGYDVFYNNILFGRMHVGPFFRRASLYFSEPSYLGFFIGLSLFFLFDVNCKFKTTLIFGLIISGFLSGSMTLLIGFSSAFASFLIFKNILKIRVATRARIYFLTFVGISISYTAFKDSIFEILDFGSRVDRDMRASRSIDLLFSSSIPHLLFGYGSTYIAKVDYLGESNSYLRLAVENGLIVLVLALGLIYKTLKKNPELMLFMLISLHSIVLFLTPFVICFLMFINYYYYHHQKSKNLQIS